MTVHKIKTERINLVNGIKDYYSTEQAGKKLGVTSQTIRRMLEKGQFPDAIKTEGGHWRIPKKYFKTTNKLDKEAEELLRRIDQKYAEVNEVDEFDL